MPDRAVLPGANGGAPTARLRRAELTDAGSLAELFCASETEMQAWLETGGALLVENGKQRPVAAVRWQPQANGWRLEPPVVEQSDTEQAYDRWLLTKLEALAIKGNVARLDVALADPQQEPYFQRLGYRPAGEGAELWSKRVGGVWQRQGHGA